MISSVSPSYNNIQYYLNFLLISLFHWTAWSYYQYQWKQDKLCHQHVSLNSATIVCFFPAVSLLSAKTDVFLFSSTSGWFYPFSRGHDFQKDAFAVFYVCFPPINFAFLPSVRWWMIHECLISHHTFTCETILTNNCINDESYGQLILWHLVKVYSVADRSKVHRVKVRSCSGWQAKVGYYSIRSFFFVNIVHIIIALDDKERYINGQVILFSVNQYT